MKRGVEPHRMGADEEARAVGTVYGAAGGALARVAHCTATGARLIEGGLGGLGGAQFAASKRGRCSRGFQARRRTSGSI
jgi:hypothetical protein